MYEVERYHDFSAGHRVVGHESKCKYLHGHNYRVRFICRPTEALDDLGRVVDFGVIKRLLCEWLEENWDHKFLLFENDPLFPILMDTGNLEVSDSVVVVPFNPTAENMAQYLVDVVGPKRLRGTGVTLHRVVIEETRKCSATYVRTPWPPKKP